MNDTRTSAPPRPLLLLALTGDGTPVVLDGCGVPHTARDLRAGATLCRGHATADTAAFWRQQADYRDALARLLEALQPPTGEQR
jgi:hypothetical protein